MSDVILSRPQQRMWREYYNLCKPKVVMLMLLTSVIGMLLATPNMVPLDILILGNLGIALCAGSAAAVNQLLDRKADADMARTHNRPLPKGTLTPMQVIMFAAVIGTLGMTILLIFINPLTAWLTLASLVGYAFIYTLFLKRATPQNIVIGGLAGAAPPLLGWTAVTNHIGAEAVILVLIIFAWTPPHFWALALHRKEEYAKVDIPMLPVTHGEGLTRLHIVLYTLVLIAVTLLPFVIHMNGYVYLVGALLLNARFLYWAIRLLRDHDPLTAIKTFRFSIIYLMALFVFLLIDHYQVIQSINALVKGML